MCDTLAVAAFSNALLAVPSHCMTSYSSETGEVRSTSMFSLAVVGLGGLLPKFLA